MRQKLKPPTNFKIEIIIIIVKTQIVLKDKRKTTQKDNREEWGKETTDQKHEVHPINHLVKERNTLYLQSHTLLLLSYTESYTAAASSTHRRGYEGSMAEVEIFSFCSEVLLVLEAIATLLQ